MNYSIPTQCTTTPLFFFFNDTATTEIYTLSLHDALPISASLSLPGARACSQGCSGTGPHRDASRQIISCSTPADRKSTRLNSSHSQISYAVFCLKKKNHNICKEPCSLHHSMQWNRKDERG